jgi:hypothetical protein
MRRVNVAVKAKVRDNPDRTWDKLRGHDGGAAWKVILAETGSQVFGGEEG